ncbi:DUF4856 domain-containing protein [Mucilaginibacter sp. UR6-1]|uniref:DUF4856 domain-containing protein n=1 Tax=Mucilaginibacter sp. UR6-1 TaxID=1435643 RepID=UPI001E350FCF|nr:DUF4856 domain-containing protein [Mucilaginibacter sp. UR6-1]MCC8411199.1 DUF4856 domain-containing protein [Mucilaginibacter sp. UR6-1]
MKNYLHYPLAILAVAILATACSKDESEDTIPQYDVPATYNFEGANYLTSTQRVKMALELNAYLGSANTTDITAAKANDYFNNTNAPFADATLNTSGINLAAKTANGDTFKGYFTQRAANSLVRATPAAPGVAGFYGNRLVDGKGIEFNQAVAKGMMGALFFKEAVNILNNVANADNNTVTNGTTAMQRQWDEAFGYLSVPNDYDTAKVYANTDPIRPLLWGGYLAERGKGIQAGGVIFNAFLKGRAAIGAKDYVVVKEQAAIIQDKWEQLIAAAALAYTTIPTQSVNVGNLATQFHALSEGFGFISCFEYRSARTKLSNADFQTLKTIIGTDFYILINEPGFAKLVQAQNILKATYGLQ